MIPNNKHIKIKTYSAPFAEKPANFNFLIKNFSKILLLDEEKLSHAVKRSCEIKAQIVSDDEKVVTRSVRVIVIKNALSFLAIATGSTALLRIRLNTLR